MAAKKGRKKAKKGHKKAARHSTAKRGAAKRHKKAARHSTAKRGAAKRHTLKAGMHRVKGKVPSAKALAKHGLKVVGVKLAKRKGAKKGKR